MACLLSMLFCELQYTLSASPEARAKFTGWWQPRLLNSAARPFPAVAVPESVCQVLARLPGFQRRPVAHVSEIVPFLPARKEGPVAHIVAETIPSDRIQAEPRLQFRMQFCRAPLPLLSIPRRFSVQFSACCRVKRKGSMGSSFVRRGNSINSLS